MKMTGAPVAPVGETPSGGGRLSTAGSISGAEIAQVQWIGRCSEAVVNACSHAKLSNLAVDAPA